MVKLNCRVPNKFFRYSLLHNRQIR
uniref:Uncharacterized protein n=1 Tax=Arundo donax TaxID=35708 RepID=A0A0A8YKQ4_ARUDO